MMCHYFLSLPLCSHVVYSIELLLPIIMFIYFFAQDSEIRIYIVEMYSTPALELFCEVYVTNSILNYYFSEGTKYHVGIQTKYDSPKVYLFLTHSWYMEGWWEEGYSNNECYCSSSHLAQVAQHSIAVLLSEIPMDPTVTDSTNTVSS